MFYWKVNGVNMLFKIEITTNYNTNLMTIEM